MLPPTKNRPARTCLRLHSRRRSPVPGSVQVLPTMSPSNTSMPPSLRRLASHLCPSKAQAAASRSQHGPTASQNRRTGTSDDWGNPQRTYLVPIEWHLLHVTGSGGDFAFAAE